MADPTPPAPDRPRFVYEHRVRYRECDPMGVVYHTHYLDWFEAARTEALRARGLAYKSLEDAGILMMVTDATLRYHRPARYDDVVEVETTFAETDGPRIPIDYAVRRQGAPRVLVSGRVVLCCVSRATMRPMPLPDAVRALLSA
jgi:acyl-CoA thioester hydrolase